MFNAQEVVVAGKLVVLSFKGASTAAGVLDTIQDMERRGLIEIEDAVIASRPARSEILTANAGNPWQAGFAYNQPETEIRQTDSRRKRSAAAGGGLGLLAGWLLGGPVGGAAVGAVLGALRDRGIDDGFMKELASRLEPDSSAIFLLVQPGGSSWLSLDEGPRTKDE
jgi:uncharacterized membrane protein